MTKMIEIAKAKTAKEALVDFVMILNPQAYTEEQINEAMKSYSAVNGKHAGKYVQLMQTPVGKEIIAAAKKGVLQRIVDLGHT